MTDDADLMRRNLRNILVAGFDPQPFIEIGRLLGGWADQISGQRLFARRAMGMPGSGLHKLFFGTNKAEPVQAAIALRSYLTTGEPRWSEALSCP